MLTVYYKMHPVVMNAEFGLQFGQSPYLGEEMKLVEQQVMKVINESWKPVTGQYNEIINHAHETTLTLKEKRPGL